MQVNHATSVGVLVCLAVSAFTAMPRAEQFGFPGGAPFSVPQPQNAPRPLGPKAAGKVRIGVAPTDAQLGQGNRAQDYGTPIRNSIVLLMNGPAVEIAPLDSHLPLQLQAEAEQKECDYVLFSSVTVKHASSGGFGKFMKMAAPAANMLPMAGMSGSRAMIAGQAAGMAAAAVAQSAQEQAFNQLAGFNGQIKSRDDVTVGYRLMGSGSETAVLQDSLNAKAQSDGEDVMTTLILKAADAILAEATKKH